MFLIIYTYNNDKIVSAIIRTETHTHKKKLIKLFRNSNIEIKVKIVTNLFRPRLYK